MNAAPFVCRGCGHEQIPINPLARARLEERGLCQGCRAAETLTAQPWLLREFVDFWRRHAFPASDSWLRRLSAAAGNVDVPATSGEVNPWGDHTGDLM